ncbi:hypothetical protein A5692_15935 [Mycobacterium sp. E342]|uniref:hypothetical protein n=1 Tax=unclassified Mycobacterium TaxID=2642494 RepID=UPI0007FCBB72|nr:MULTISPECIES: hypothetical protein [unclassified Mycobacterium]OBH16865.1 hypothetical protein A9X04_11240 [Mycobacterium sp. E3247]OBH32091.1 hypothetical protein A5692_15935 [Mycobacterium sp. E342]
MMRLNRHKLRIEEHEPRDDAPNVDEHPPGTDAGAEDIALVRRRSRVQSALVFGLLPGLAMLLAGGVGYLKWQKTTDTEIRSAQIESVQAASESTVKILTYSPDSVDRELQAARDRLTGNFRDAYTQLTHDVVIPGSKEKKIAAVATVPAAASISASPNRAVVMVFVNQSITVGNDPPSTTASTVRVTVDRRDNHWLISDFAPI